MSVPSVVKGQFWNIAVEPVPDSGDYVVICGLNTRNITHQVNTQDEAIRDCELPQQVPWRILSATSQQKDMSGTGLHNRAQGDLIRSLIGVTLNYRMIESEPGGDLVGQGMWEGPFMLTNWQEGASDGANVSSQFTFASDGVVEWVSTTAELLVALGLTPLTATASSEWTGALSAMTPGSVVTATTVGGVVLTVHRVEDATTGTVTGTFVATGSKVVTLTETHPEASNSPLVTTKTVVVS